MKVLVCGGRDFYDYERLCRVLDFVRTGRDVTHIIHGAAPGADVLSGVWANARGLECSAYPARWFDSRGRLDRAAGPIRNQRMLDENTDIGLVVAFPGGRGTADMVRRARRAGIEVLEVDATNE